MKWYVYILHLNNGAYYTGITNNIEARIKKHNDGRGSKYVRSHLPFICVYLEELDTKSDALKREAAIKRLSHEQKTMLVIKRYA
jgi:putative endonuclease